MNIREAKSDPSASREALYSSMDHGDSSSREWRGAGRGERRERGPGTDANMFQKGESELLGGNGVSQEDGSSSLAVELDVDGQPVELDVDVQELGRKKKELQQIEEQIILKRASIAMKQVAPLLKAMEVEEMKKRKLAEEVKDEKSPTLSSSKVKPQYVKDVPFKDRVNGILQNCKKHRARAQHTKGSPQQSKALFQPPTMSKSFVERMNASILKQDGCLKKIPPKQEDEEPGLKSRVKELMQLRSKHGFVPPSNQKVVEVECDRLTQNPEDPDPGQDPAAKGFQRFLNLLNKGVDIDRLAKIVNDIPCEDGVHGHLQPAGRGQGSHGGAPPWQGSHDGAPPRQGSHDGAPPWQGSHNGAPPWRGSHDGAPPWQGSHDGAPPRDHSRSTSGERTVRTALDSPSLSVLREESPRRSLPGEVKKDVNPEEERKYGEMHDLLQTIGLDLGLDEVGQLSDRIQARLYGRNGHAATKRGAREDERKRKHAENQREREGGENQRETERSPRKTSGDGVQVLSVVSDSVSRDNLETSVGQSIPTLTRSCPSQPTPYPAPVDMSSAYTLSQQPHYLTQHVHPHPKTFPPSWGATPRPAVYSANSASYLQYPPIPPYYQTQMSYPPPGYLPPPDTSIPGPSQSHWTGTQ